MKNSHNIRVVKRLNLLNKFIHGINECKTKKDIYEYIAIKLPSLIHADHASVSLLDEANKTLKKYDLSGKEVTHDENTHPVAQILQTNTTTSGFALLKQGTYVTEYPNKKCSKCAAKAYCAAFSKLGYVTGMTTPIYIRGQAIGTINVASSTKNVYSKNTQKVFETIALLVSAALEKIHFIGMIGSSKSRINTHAARLKMLTEISMQLSHARTEENLLQVAFDFFSGNLSANKMSYVTVDKKQQKFTLAYGCNNGEFSSIKIDLPMRKNLLTNVVNTEETQFHTSLDDKEKTNPQKNKTNYAWSIPIFKNDEVSRLLNLSTHVEPNYINDLIDIFTIFSSLFSAALEAITANEVIAYRAQHDLLTGAHNRHSFQEKINGLINGKPTKPFTLLIIDLDGFKQLNDFHGHLFGDKVLTKVVGHFQTIFGQESFVARLGGDEFAVIGDFSKYKSSMLNGMKLNTLKIEHEGRIIPVGFSAGIAHFPRHAKSKSELMKFADLALYKAKVSTSNIKVFNNEIAKQFNQKFDLLNEFKVALSEDRIVPFYQPIIDLKTQKLYALEALARWDHKMRGMLSPADFSDVFEVPELSAKIAYVMHQRICKDMAEWKRNGINFNHVGLNVETVNLLDPAFPLFLLSELQKNGLDPSEYAIEITENFILNSQNKYIHECLNSLQQARMSIVLDDFGTGFSSISHLKDLPITNVKLDKSYVTKSLSNEKNYHIVNSIIGLAKKLNINTVAEGIETGKEKSLFTGLMCDYGQGFFFSRPLLAQEIPNYINTLENKKVEPLAA